jgi:hypothetical protein
VLARAVFGRNRTGHPLESYFESGGFTNVKRLLLVALCSGVAISAAEPFSASAVAPGAGASVAQYLVALPHIAYGGGWRTQIVIGNTSAAAADVTLYYFADNGNPLSLAIGGVFSDHTALTVPANGQQTVEPDWQGANAGGWAGLVYSNTGLKIQGIFLWHNPADPADKYTESAAPIVNQSGPACVIPLPGSASYTMPYDETGGRFSGYGFANTGAGPVTMNLTFYGQTGQVVGQYSEPLVAFGHDAFLVKDKLPQVVGQKGAMVITGQGVVPLGFRFNPNYSFMTWLP